MLLPDALSRYLSEMDIDNEHTLCSRIGTLKDKFQKEKENKNVTTSKTSKKKKKN